MEILNIFIIVFIGYGTVTVIAYAFGDLIAEGIVKLINK